MLTSRKRLPQLVPSVAEKACSRCKQVLPASEFYPHRRMKSGLQSHCRACSRAWHHERPDYVRAKNAAYKAKNPTYGTDRSRIVRFGLTPKDVARLINEQGGKCPGCQREVRSIKQCVDHCHATGRVRGIICDDCNITLGRVRDDPETLMRLAAYLAESRIEAEAHT